MLGPAGAGKSTLLKAIAGGDPDSPEFWWHGRVESASGGSPAFLDQSARLYTGTVCEFITANVAPLANKDAHACAASVLRQVGLAELARSLDTAVGTLSLAQHKLIMIATLMAEQPACVLLDEPLSGVAVCEEQRVLEFIASLGNKTTVVLVTHNKLHARAVCNHVALFSAGRLVEVSPTAEFFSKPRTALGSAYLESGSAWPESSSDAGNAEPTQSHELRPGTNGFRWTIRGELGGMAQPGLYGFLERDLAWLRHVGVNCIVNLRHTSHAEAAIERTGFRLINFPIEDMSVPEASAMLELCQRIEELLGSGHVIAIHCRAGKGRTGTALACFLAFRGLGPLQCIERARRSNPTYIETAEQAEFVRRFAKQIVDNNNESDASPKNVGIERLRRQ